MITLVPDRPVFSLRLLLQVATHPAKWFLETNYYGVILLAY